MNYSIIGTAGHVDHGKTSLIKALSGFDLDSLKEEKARGITIEPGFAYLTLPSGERCGIIDVPGHERFIRNMLAGAGSVNIALFVVSCDEGMMPQSREHLDILSLLGVKRGVIALTKADLADQDWIDLVALTVSEEVKGTFLEHAPIIPVSVRTGAGIETLKQCLFDMISNAEEEEDFSPARLPVDRVFSVDGFGTVVTGTLTQGRLCVGDELTVYPSLARTKVRNLQRHGENVQFAKKNQRVAVNLSGLKTSDLKKGCVLAYPDSMYNTRALDVRLDILKDTPRKIMTHSRLHLYHGTETVLCRLVLLADDELPAGKSGYAQLQLEDPISAKVGDRFVVRFFSPMETVGGGVILDPFPQKRKRKDSAVLDMFKTKEQGKTGDRLLCFINDRSRSFPNPAEIKLKLFNNNPIFDAALENLVQKGEIFFVKDSVISRPYLKQLAAHCKQILNDFHTQNPLLEGMRKDILRARLLPDVPQAVGDAVLELFEKQKSIVLAGILAATAEFKSAMSGSQKKLNDEIIAVFLRAGFSPPQVDEFMQRYPKEQKEIKQALNALIAHGTLVALTPQIFIHKDNYIKAQQLFAKMAQVKAVTTLEFRDATQSSRKYTYALLDHFDSKGFTIKQGDVRVLTHTPPK